MFRQIYEQLQLDADFPFVIFETSEKQQFLHYHDFLELNIVEYGEGSYMIDGRNYPILPGDIFVINNKEPHMAVHQSIHDGSLKLTVLAFDISLLWRNKEISRFLTPFFSRKEQFSHRIGSQSRYYPQMAELFRTIAQEYQEQEKGWQSGVESLLMYLLTLLYRCYDEKQELEEERKDFQKLYTRICAVFEYIDRHFCESITLDQLAELVSLSPHYLCKCFKKVTGRTIFEYIEQMRIQYSCYLLRTTEDSILDIAWNSGFRTVSYYNRVFKKSEGISPRDYRRQKISRESL